MKHGGAGTAYVYNKCRCDECREANRIRVARRRNERRAEPKAPDDPRHGKSTFYSNHGCRCEKCTAAWSAECKRYADKRKENASK